MYNILFCENLFNRAVYLLLSCIDITSHHDWYIVIVLFVFKKKLNRAKTQYIMWKKEVSLFITEQKQPWKTRQISIFIVFEKDKKIRITYFSISIMDIWCIKWDLIGYICKMIKRFWIFMVWGNTDRGWYIYNLLIQTIKHLCEGLVWTLF